MTKMTKRTWIPISHVESWPYRPLCTRIGGHSMNQMPTNTRRFFAALDLGQVSDFSTLAVIERVELVGDWDPVVFAWEKRTMLRLRYLERIPLGTPYPDVVRRVNEVMRQVAVEGTSELVVDGTGVGRPVVDLLRRSGLRCS